MSYAANIETCLEDLPVLPAVVARLTALDPDSDGYWEQVLALGREDPTFALRLIRAANGGTPAPRDPITQLKTAITRLGTHQVSDLERQLEVTPVAVPTSESARRLWIHSIQTAVAAQSVAWASQTEHLHLGEAYLCGLLHDIGRFVIFSNAPDDLSRVDERGWDSPRMLLPVEFHTLGFDHAELGARACQVWTVPQIITEVVAHHHVYDFRAWSVSDPRALDLIHIVQIADFLSVLLMAEPDLPRREPEEIEEMVDEFCFPAVGVDRIISDHQLGEMVHRIAEDSARYASGIGL